MSTCLNCKYWGNDNDRRKYNEPAKECQAIQMGEGWNKEKLIKMKAFVQDGSSYYAALWTMEDFGCLKFEEKD